METGVRIIFSSGKVLVYPEAKAVEWGSDRIRLMTKKENGEIVALIPKDADVVIDFNDKKLIIDGVEVGSEKINLWSKNLEI